MEKKKRKGWFCTIAVGIASIILFRYFKAERRRREDEESD